MSDDLDALEEIASLGSVPSTAKSTRQRQSGQRRLRQVREHAAERTHPKWLQQLRGYNASVSKKTNTK